MAIDIATLFNDDVRRDPFGVYAQIRSSSPVLHVPAIDAWMLFDYESVRRAMHDHDAFGSSVVPPTGKAPDWLVFTDPPRHSKLRALILRAFTPRSISNLEPRVQAMSKQLLRDWPTQGRSRHRLAVCRGAADHGHRGDARHCSGGPRAMHSLERGRNGSQLLGGRRFRGRAGHRPARDGQGGDGRISRRAPFSPTRRSSRRPFDRVFALSEIDGERLSDADLLGFFQLLLAAGTETTTNLISNALICLMDHPDQLARLRAEPTALPRAIEEVVRFRSPAQVMFRQTRQDVEMRGTRIPAGKFVMAVVGSANRDPVQFPDPDRFDIDRHPNPHLGFGHGIHFCIGAALARLEANVALGQWLERFARFEILDPQTWQPRRALLAHGPARLVIQYRA